MLKDLHKANNARSEKVVDHVNNALTDLWNVVNRKNISENENPDKLIDIVEEPQNHKFNKQQEKGLMILTSKKVALAQAQIGNTAENVLNEIRQITYSLYQAKEINKKV